MAAMIQASPPCSSRKSSRAGSPAVMMMTMPASEISMPATCRGVARSRSRSQEQAMVNAGADEFISTALIVVVVRRPWYTIVWKSGTLSSASSARIFQFSRITAPFPATAFRPKGTSTTSAMVQRQKLRLTGSNESRSARPSTQLPAQRRLVKASSENAVRRALEACSVRLLVGVVGRAHERPDGRVAKAERGGVFFILRKNRGLDVTLHRKVMRRGLQVLPDGEHVDGVRAQVAHHGEDLVILLAEAHHQPGLGRHVGVDALEFLQQAERMRIIATRPRAPVEARHGLEIVVHHIRRRGFQDLERPIEPPAEVRHQHLDRRLRARRAHGADAIDEVLRAAVLQVVAVHA